MDARLQDFIRQVETLSDVRNRDPINPIAIDMDIPGLSRRYRVVGSISEPTNQAYPINVIWVVLDSNNPFFRRALQLRSATANDISVEDRIEGNFLGTWVEIQQYADLFVLPQYYTLASGGGEQGPQGPKGDPGYNLRGNYSPTETYMRDDTVFYNGSSYSSKVNDNRGSTPGEGANWGLVAQKGDTPEVDYEHIINTVVSMLAPDLLGITLSGLPTSIFETRTAQLQVVANYSDGSTVNITNQCIFTVLPSSAGSVSATGMFTAASVTADANAVVRATWTSQDNVAYTSEQNTTVVNKVPVSIAVAGPTSVNEQSNATYTATVTYNDGSSVAAPSAGRTFSVSPSEAGSINASSGVFTAADVASNTNAVVSCSFTESGVTVTGTRNITVVATLPKIRYGVGPAITNMASYNDSFISTVTTNQVANAGAVQNDFSINTGSGQYGYVVHPKSFGVMTFIDLSNNFEGGWDGAQNDIMNSAKWGPYEFTATVNGVTEQYYVYRKDMPNQGSENWRIRP